MTSLGSAIFAFLAAGAFKTVEEAQAALCPKFRVIEPDPAAASVYEELYPVFDKLYFAFGASDDLRVLRRVAAAQRSQNA